MHVRVSGVWQQVLATGFHVRVSGTWRQVQEGWVRVSGVWQRFFQAVVYSLIGATYNDTAATVVGVPGACTVTLTVRTDGTVRASGSASGTLASQDWITPTSAVTTNYWSRWSSTAGSLSSGSEATWEQLTTNRAYAKSYVGLTGTDAVTGTLEIATDSGGSNVVASDSFTLEPGVQEF